MGYDFAGGWISDRVTHQGNQPGPMCVFVSEYRVGRPEEIHQDYAKEYAEERSKETCGG